MLGSVLAFLSVAALAAPHGFRVEGSGHANVDAAPLSWAYPGDARWSVPLDGWSNSSPVRLADQICTLSEPVHVHCYAISDGRPRWSVALEVAQTLEPSRDQDALAKIRAANEALDLIPSLRREQSKLARAARRGDEQAEAEQEKLTFRIAELEQVYQQGRAYLARDDREQVGYTSSTPIAADHLYAMMGNGVVASLTASGSVRWSVWLGALETRTSGFSVGHSASPVLVGDTLVVPWNHLTGLDPKTGAVRWTHDAPYGQYGSPAPVTVGGQHFVVTPGGAIVRVSDGEIVHQGLGTILWASPAVRGTSVYMVGSSQTSAKPPGPTAQRFELSLTNGSLSVASRWSVNLDTLERFYASPTVDDDYVFVLSRDCEIFQLDARTGETLRRVERPGQDCMSSPLLTPEHLYVSPTAKDTDVFERESLTHLGGSALPSFRSTPFVDEGRMYVRTLDALIAIGP